MRVTVAQRTSGLMKCRHRGGHCVWFEGWSSHRGGWRGCGRRQVGGQVVVGGSAGLALDVPEDAAASARPAVPLRR